MCGRYGFSIKDAREVYSRFNTVNTLNDLSSESNITPGQLNPVIYQINGNIIERMFWGLIPYWAKNKDLRYKTINARSETVKTAASFRKPFLFQRCLIPVTGFYEWDKTKKPSQPYYFKMVDDSIFSFAGLYDIWIDPQKGEKIKSYTIITTQPNELVAKIHNRMPVILNKDDEELWLNPAITETRQLLPLLKAYNGNMEKIVHPASLKNTLNYLDFTI
jgi:putative SOS response-associated peptidase YedK